MAAVVFTLLGPAVFRCDLRNISATIVYFAMSYLQNQLYNILEHRTA